MPNPLPIVASLGILLAHAPAAEPVAPAKAAGEKPLAAARLEFNPGGGPWKGETPFQGASWTALGPGFGSGKGLTMQARAGVGDRFPVSHPQGPALFEIVLENGMDDHLVVLITSGEGEQKVRLPRDKKVEATVGGGKFTLLFPTSHVAAEPGTRPTTNKATIFVTQLP
jgi:hypothetical protein